MLPDEKRRCHHTGFKESCKKLVADGRCTRWISVSVKDPKTGEPTLGWDCSDNWIPILLINNVKEVYHLAAATESFRNEVHVGNEAMGLLLSQRAQLGANDGPKRLG